ncbi:unnamed protein product [Psylliodes chrysocephalus]|uniref:Uncharacterized protein n=1 Tax=Psylliodes chrysocephalus TaxID=3402493 RepID=A0A9P0D6Z7_9CUCU|nr:unnamed protein product [Psylliodes chrysocephala]
MALKIFTSSRKIIDIIHRYGHCISYPGVEELKSTFYSVQKSTICPKVIRKNPNLCTGIAFDNFDRFIETKSGKDTLHDTVGVIYRNEDPNTLHETETQNLPSATSEECETTGKRQRRTMENIEVEGKPYMKKPKMTDELQISIHEAEGILPVSLQLYKDIDVI